MLISETTIEQAKQTSLIDIVAQYVALKKKGNDWNGTCPFHVEKTPSFYIYDKASKYKCHGCGEGGSSAVDFLMAKENLTFPDAVNRLASFAGLSVDAVPTIAPRPMRETKKQLVDVIPAGALQANLEAYKRNGLYIGIASLYGRMLTTNVFRTYNVGSCKRLDDGTTLFVQQDINGHYRQCKAIAYNPSTVKRRKDLEPVIMGKAILSKYSGKAYDSIDLKQCFFGEHLLKGNNKEVGILESEKSCLIASLFYPRFIWLATGGKNGCSWYSKEVASVLKGRKVFLFPDVDGYPSWSEKAVELEAITGQKVKVIDIMCGEPAPKGKEKYDLADLLIDSGKQPAQQLVINESDIAAIPCNFLYKDYQAQTFLTNQGQYVDVLFDTVGEILPISNQIEGYSIGNFCGISALMSVVFDQAN